jgi:phytoene dehydrogenase-like protein
MTTYNGNFVGGDIITGRKDIRQLIFGPRITLSPYRIGVAGMYICSAATPRHRDRGHTACAVPTLPKLRSNTSVNGDNA